MPSLFQVSRRAGLVTALLCLTALLASVSPPARAASDEAERAAITARLEDFMNRYEQNDQAGVVALIDPKEFMFLGGPDDKVTNAEGLEAFMTRSFQQWQTVRFTDLRDLDIRIGKDVATAWYLFNFAAAGQPSLPFRVMTTWRKDGKQWVLTQCASWLQPG